MNLSNNLKKIRKDNNLSQEDLAEKLGVSRQSVSKWESNQAYPEMDKVLQICKMFDVSIDDLLNQDIKKIENEKKSKINVNKYIEDFLNYITKTINMFSNMKFKEILKCIIEQLLIIFTMSIIAKIFGGIMADLLRSILFFLNEHSYSICYHALAALYSVLCIITIIVIVLHIFKIRYLDYYEIVDKEEKEEVKEDLKEDNNEKTTKSKREKLVIRDPNHSGYKFIFSLLKVLLIIVKIFALFFVFFLCFTFISLVSSFVISFMFVKTGTLFVGIILSILACLLVNYILLDLLYHFYINTKPKFTILGIMFISSLVIVGVGAGLLLCSIPKFEVVNSSNKKYFITDEKTYEMKDDLIIHDYYYDLKYVETDSNDIKIECTHSKIYNVSFEEENNGYINVEKNVDNEMDLLKQVIKDINNNRIVNYGEINVTVYASKENIQKLEENRRKKYINEYEQRIDELENELDKKEDEIYNLQDKIYDLEEKIEQLED